MTNRLHKLVSAAVIIASFGSPAFAIATPETAPPQIVESAKAVQSKQNTAITFLFDGTPTSKQVKAAEKQLKEFGKSVAAAEKIEKQAAKVPFRDTHPVAYKRACKVRKWLVKWGIPALQTAGAVKILVGG